MINSKAEFDEIYRMLESDLRTLFKLVFAYRRPVAEGDIRIASVILRKWLLDGLLSDFCGAARVTPTLFADDNSEVLDVLKTEPSIVYFLTGGIRFNGTPVRGVSYSTLPYGGKLLLPLDRLELKQFTLKDFLQQRRLFFEGTFFTCSEIIRFTVNKLGGAHLDFDRKKFAQLERAASYFRYGGPKLDFEDLDPSCNIYMILEPKSAEILSGLHIEIIAAATSFIQLRLDDTPLLELKTHTSLQTRFRRLLGKDKPRFSIFKL